MEGKVMGIPRTCKEQAAITLGLLEDLREHQLDIIKAVAFPQKAKEEMLFQINSQINTIREFYPPPGSSPLINIVLSGLEEIKDIASEADRENPEPALLKVAKKYDQLIHEKLLDKMLEDVLDCACREGGVLVERDREK